MITTTTTTTTTTAAAKPLWLATFFLLCLSTSAFQTTGPAPFAASTTELFMAKKKGNRSGKPKGFGDKPASKPAAAKKESTEAFSPMSTKPEAKPVQGTQALPNTEFDTGITGRTADQPGASDMNQGQIALARMRREQAEKKDAELRKVKAIRDADKMLQSSPQAAAIPEKVAMRMGRRMLPFVGIPLFGSLGAFVAFWYFATYKDMEFQPGMVATTTIVILASGLLGITYSIVSASWDEDREGSFLGIEEFQKNVASIREGLDRSKENLILREKMAGLPESEIEAAIADLEKREKKKQQTFQSMMEELEQ